MTSNCILFILNFLSSIFCVIEFVKTGEIGMLFFMIFNGVTAGLMLSEILFDFSKLINKGGIND